MTPRHAEARRLATAGIPVFPCLPGDKAPATARGFHERTTDLAQIDAWWAEADYNLGIVPADQGLVVLDIDMKNSADGWAELEALAAEWFAEVPVTYAVDTPSGGAHLYFKGELPDGKLTPHVDIKCSRGYVLVPPSIIGSKSYVH
jgi:hypothetical protein